MQVHDMPAPDTDRALQRSGVGIRFRVFEPTAEAAGTVLMLPPWAIVPSDIYAPQVHALRASHRVVVIDGRGTGGSGRPGTVGAYRSDEYVADAVAVLDLVAVEQVHLVGLSFGGHLAALLAAAHPERAASATLIAPSAPFGPANPHMTPERFLGPWNGEPGWATFNRAAFLADYAAFARFFIREATGPGYDALVEQGVRFAQQTDGATLALTVAARADAARTEGVERYQCIRCPALVIHGDADRIVPVAKGKLVAKAIGAPFRLLRHAGHVPNQTHARTVNRMLLSFLHDLDKQASRVHVATRINDIPMNQGA
jgi:pimeloyl-ACP methyl ester carboxylesterase